MNSDPAGKSPLLRPATLIGLAITLIAAVLLVQQISLLEKVEEHLLDYRFILRGARKPPDGIIIAAIDEKSLARVGRWPWPRRTIATLIDRLAASGAELVVMDVILSEPDRDDPLLARAIRDAGNVILPVVFRFPPEAGPAAPQVLRESSPLPVRHAERFGDVPPVTASGVMMPVEQLAREAMGLGHINMLADEDGTLRWETFVIALDGCLYPSLALQTAVRLLGIPPEQVAVAATQGIDLGKRFLPTDPHGRMVINYYGTAGTFPNVSIADIMDGSAPPERLRGKVVIVGATAAGIYDLRVTPMAAALPGVEKHAAVVASIMTGAIIRPVPLWMNLALLLTSGTLFSLLIPRFSALGAAISTLLALALLALTGYLLFARQGLWIALAAPGNNLLAIFIAVTAYNYTVEEQRARKIRAMFSNYVTRSIVNELIDNPESARLGGELREVTILFSDIRGFTTFSEQHSPKEVVAILNEYLEAMTDIILRWNGTPDKFIGDAIVAFWGAPLPSDTHPEQAVGCAVEMRRRLGELRDQWQRQGKTPLWAGVGINTGEVVVGNIGAEGKKMDYTIIGDQVNLCARVESLTRKYDASILLTEYTVAKLREAVAAGRLGNVAISGLEQVVVKGKEQPVGIYRVEEDADTGGPVITEPAQWQVVKLSEK